MSELQSVARKWANALKTIFSLFVLFSLVLIVVIGCLFKRESPFKDVHI